MSLVLVTGGAASGKSAYAERVALSMLGPHVYVATMMNVGEDAAAKVERHRALRDGKGFRTIERSRDVAGMDPADLAGATVLLECLGTLVANQLFTDQGVQRDAALVAEELVAGVAHLAAHAANVVVVTEEVGSGLLPMDAGSRAYVNVIGRVNERVAAQADAAVAVLCGLPLALKGSLPVLGADANAGAAAGA